MGKFLVLYIIYKGICSEVSVNNIIHNNMNKVITSLKRLRTRVFEGRVELLQELRVNRAKEPNQDTFWYEGVVWWQEHISLITYKSVNGCEISDTVVKIYRWPFYRFIIRNFLKVVKGSPIKNIISRQREKTAIADISKIWAYIGNITDEDVQRTISEYNMPGAKCDPQRVRPRIR